jgi:hypothetical protein
LVDKLHLSSRFIYQSHLVTADLSAPTPTLLNQLPFRPHKEVGKGYGTCFLRVLEAAYGNSEIHYEILSLYNFRPRVSSWFGGRLYTTIISWDLVFFCMQSNCRSLALCDVTVCFRPGCCLLHIRHIILCVPKGAWASAEWYRGEGQGTRGEFCNRTWNEVGRLRCTIR